MIVGTVRILPGQVHRREALEMLRSIEGPVLAERGCLSFDIYEEQGEERGIVLIERWEDRRALETHLRSDVYRRVLEAIELSGSAPAIRFDDVSGSEGLELVERLRKPSPIKDADPNGHDD